MSFYSKFSKYYEMIFPYREVTYQFLKSHLNKGGKAILDVGCGTGHYCGKFGGEGFTITGIDLNEEMIMFARNEYPSAGFFQLDMFDIDKVDGSFDLIYSVGNVVPHLPKKLLPEFLEKVYSKLNPNGTWIFQTVNWNFVLLHNEYVFPDRVLGEERITFRRMYSSIDEERVIFETALEKNGGSVFSDETILYPLRSECYIDLHLLSGFKFKGHFSSFERGSFNPNKDSANILVFNKPGE
jgi:SAM-dependent methyltransferase